MKRIFISINLPEESISIARQIQSMIRKEIAKTRSDYSEHIKWELSDKFHLTLFFCGDSSLEMIEQIDHSLTEVVAGFDFDNIELMLNRVDAFPNLKIPRVIYLSIDNSDGRLSMIAFSIKGVITKLGFSADKPFRPHLTIGRVKRDRKLNLSVLQNLSVPDHCCEVHSLFLMESRLMRTGSEYSVIKEYKFGRK